MSTRYQIVDKPDDREWRWFVLRKRVLFWWWPIDRWPYKPARSGARDSTLLRATARLRLESGNGVVYDTHAGGGE